MTYTQDPLFYTNEEHLTALSAVTENANFQIQKAKDNLSLEQAENTLTAIRGLVEDYTLSRDTAVTTYNAIADLNGWANIKSITRTYTVEALYNGTIIGEFSGIEADDEESAQQEVADNLEVEASMNLTLSFNGDSISGEAYVDEWDISDNFTFTATEEE